MEIIPVIDVQGGIVVQAIGGHRERYQPLKSKLTDSVRPLDVARAMLKVTGSDKLYVADLDAIEHEKEVHTSIYELRKCLGIEVWLDAGNHVLSGCKQVLGSESLVDTDWWLFNALSMDFRNGELISNGLAITTLDYANGAVQAGVQTIIVLDVATVGKGKGPTTAEICRQIRQDFSDITIWTGGGIRDWGDIRFLERVAGVDGVLVSTALHQGAIR